MQVLSPLVVQLGKRDVDVVIVYEFFIFVRVSD